MIIVFLVLLLGSLLPLQSMQAPYLHGNSETDAQSSINHHNHHNDDTVRFITHPTRVDHRGEHLSYNLHPQHSSLHLTRQRHKRTASLEGSDIVLEEHGRTYFKLNAFNRNLLLNLSLSTDFINRGMPVKYLNVNGSSRLVRQQEGQDTRECFHTGHVHRMSEDGGVADTTHMVEEGWAAVSNCAGQLRGVMLTQDGYLFIEPSGSRATVEGTSEDNMADQPQEHVVYRQPDVLNSSERKCSLSTDNKAKKHHTPKMPAVSQPSSKPSLSLSMEEGQMLRRRRRRSTEILERFVETVIVADETMLGHHGRESLEAYLFTLMNIVFHLYREPSIGHALNIVLVRTIIFETSQINSTNNANSLLQNFCLWQKSENERSNVHHDIAVMVTRRNICEGNGFGCVGTLGMGNIGGACQPESSCNLNKDIGLSTAFTIAHEIGHNLGLLHDGDPMTQCPPETKYIMAPSFAESVNPHVWSECSRQQLKKFFSQPESSCLNNRPAGVYQNFSSSHAVPGMEYTPTEQCQLQRGENATHCPGMENECGLLWCKPAGSSQCSHRNSPPAPGTECRLEGGAMGVCYQGLCIDYPLLSEPRDGGWGEWSEWSTCSRSCGVGVQFSERECNSPIPANGGRYCLGQWKRYRTCNTQGCPGNGNYRQQLCQENPPNHRYSSWETVELEHIVHLDLDICKHQCIPTGTNLIHTRMVDLPDGAPCQTDESLGVCVSGVCKAIGCDYQFNGTRSRKDECGVWCGDGTTCMRVSGTFNAVEHPGRYNYYKAVTIPKGSAHIHVTEIESSHNVIAAYSSISEEFKNGNFKILPTGFSSFFFAGSSWVYERPAHGTEYFETEGPIDENVTFFLLANSSYEGIRYTFSVPNDAIYLLSNVTYFWNTTSWSECSARCGTGERSREVVCMKLYPSGEREEVDSSLCDPDNQPNDVETCTKSPCLYKWNVTDWSICSSVCGQGQQVRHAHCELVNTDSEVPLIVQDSLCKQAEKPELSQECFVEDCQYDWHYGDWSVCDSHCGEGWKEREVVCLWMNLWLDNGGELRSATVSDSHCDLGARRAEIVICYAESCSNYQWLTTEWTECTAPCNNEGSQSRSMFCQHVNGTLLASELCSQNPAPTISRTCYRECESDKPHPSTTTTTQVTASSSETTPTDTPTTTTISTCVNTDTDYFCNDIVVPFGFCLMYYEKCCGSCSASAAGSN